MSKTMDITKRLPVYWLTVGVGGLVVVAVVVEMIAPGSLANLDAAVQETVTRLGVILPAVLSLVTGALAIQNRTDDRSSPTVEDEENTVDLDEAMSA